VFFALGAYVAISIKPVFGFGPTLIASPFLIALFGMAIEVFLLRRIYTGDPNLGLLLTFGIAMIIEQAIRVLWGPAGLPFDIPNFFSGLLSWGFIDYSAYRTFVMVFTFIILGLIWFFLEKTPYGQIIRAGSRDPEMVQMMGISLSNIFTLVFGIGIFMSAAAGVLSSPLWGVHPAMGTSALLPSFAVVTIGGLGSFWGAVLAGLLVGEVSALTTLFWPVGSDLMIFIFMALILLIRPRGLMGEAWERFE
jgi:branched-chain amino acid transport system permease protein